MPKLQTHFFAYILDIYAHANIDDKRAAVESVDW